MLVKESIESAARTLIRQHGIDAYFEAGEMVMQQIEAGDKIMAERWRQIMDRVRQLERCEIVELSWYR